MNTSERTKEGNLLRLDSKVHGKLRWKVSMNNADHVSESVVYSAQSKHLRPSNRYLTSLSFPADDYCLLIGEVPAGAIVPLHSHSDRETFYVLSGEMNFYDGAWWQVLKQGEFVDVLGNTRHAWRNASESSASFLVATTVRMGVFLQKVSSAASTQAAGTEKDQFLKLVQEYGYWLGSPEDNEAIGLVTDWHGVGERRNEEGKN